ncbi:MAG: hypothetical protein GC166_06680 [Alphaproteobacteria bacterium]|nr:hypothetical protein [Alphaproteobacteria bacterium]
MREDITISIVKGDICQVDSEVMVLKFAQAHYGADSIVADILRSNGKLRKSLKLAAGEVAEFEGTKGITANCILFIGTRALADFSYRDVEEFGYRAVHAVTRERPHARSMSLTFHGPGFGLDEAEAGRALVTGIINAFRGYRDHKIRNISVVEMNAARVQRVSQVLSAFLSSTDVGSVVQVSHTSWRISADEEVSAFNKVRLSGEVSVAQSQRRGFGSSPHVFVAMPFAKEFEDIYYYGIQGPVHEANFLCERVDQISFVGDILEKIKSKIRSAKLVIADLSGANPNVYLEVGYAWGLGIPTILLLKKDMSLLFDVRGQRCLIYDGIRDLEQKLATELSTLVD